MRITDKSILRPILEHPDIYPNYYTEGDVFDALSPTVVTYYLIDGCLFPCLFHEKSVEIHAAILPELRGKRAIEAAKKVFSHIFQFTDCLEITAKVKSRMWRSGLWARGSEAIAEKRDGQWSIKQRGAAWRS